MVAVAPHSQRSPVVWRVQSSTRAVSIAESGAGAKATVGTLTIEDTRMEALTRNGTGARRKLRAGEGVHVGFSLKPNRGSARLRWQHFIHYTPSSQRDRDPRTFGLPSIRPVR